MIATSSCFEFTGKLTSVFPLWVQEDTASRPTVRAATQPAKQADGCVSVSKTSKVRPEKVIQIVYKTMICLIITQKVRPINPHVRVSLSSLTSGVWMVPMVWAINISMAMEATRSKKAWNQSVHQPISPSRYCLGRKTHLESDIALFCECFDNPGIVHIQTLSDTPCMVYLTIVHIQTLMCGTYAYIDT